MVDLVTVHSHQVLDPWVLCELGLGDAPQGEEVGAEPYLFYVGLMGVLGDDLLDGELLPALDMAAQPHQREAPSAQQLDLLEPIGEPVAEGLLLLLSEPIAILLLLVDRVVILFVLVLVLGVLGLGRVLPPIVPVSLPLLLFFLLLLPLVFGFLYGLHCLLLLLLLLLVAGGLAHPEVVLVYAHAYLVVDVLVLGGISGRPLPLRSRVLHLRVQALESLNLGSVRGLRVLLVFVYVLQKGVMGGVSLALALLPVLGLVEQQPQLQVLLGVALRRLHSASQSAAVPLLVPLLLLVAIFVPGFQCDPDALGLVALFYVGLLRVVAIVVALVVAAVVVFLPVLLLAGPIIILVVRLESLLPRPDGLGSIVCMVLGVVGGEFVLVSLQLLSFRESLLLL